MCKDCKRWFQINRRSKLSEAKLLLEHVNGISFRNLAITYQINPSTAYRKTLKALKSLPHCADITRQYCSRFSGILLVDGKFVKVKPYEHKIPVIYGIDYLTHDIPTFYLAKSESYYSCLSLFTSLRLLNYPLQGLVCDDNQNIMQACKQIYPKAIIQLCTNHYKENIRSRLQVRTDSSYQEFMRQVETLFNKRRSQKDITKRASNILAKYEDDVICLSVISDIYQRRKELFAHLDLKGMPPTNNLIECFNSHLQGRLKTIKRFQSITHAKLWLNAYFIRRRTKIFTDCRGKFKKLNGKTSLEKSGKPDIDIPIFF